MKDIPIVSSVHDTNDELIHDGRNNLGVVSLNLPRIALESEGNEKLFYDVIHKS